MGVGSVLTPKDLRGLHRGKIIEYNKRMGESLLLVIDPD